jgi:hypothetical protein
MKWFSFRRDNYLPPTEESKVLPEKEETEKKETSPINGIYFFLKKEDYYEEKGCKDALCNPDRSYKERNMSVIKSHLEVLFKEANLKYGNDLRRINSKIKLCSDEGLLDIVEQITAEKEILEQHIAELKKMQEDLQKGESYMVGVFESYEKGFQRGVTALALGNYKVIKSNEQVDY